MKYSDRQNRVLSESMEDYLETIYHLIEERQVARAKDISSRMGVNGSSVTGALRGLSERHLVHYQPYDFVTLTEEGKRIAERVVHRHEALKEFLKGSLGCSEAESDLAACRLEHAFPEDLMDRFMEFVARARQCPECKKVPVSRARPRQRT